MNAKRIGFWAKSGAIFTAIAAVLGALPGCAVAPDTTTDGTDQDADTQTAPQIQVIEERDLRHFEARLADTMIDPRRDLVVERKTIDERGMSHLRVQQTVKGVPVLGGEAIAHVGSDGQLFALTDNLVRDVDQDLDVNPAFDATKAVELAVAACASGERFTGEPRVALWLLRREEGARERRAAPARDRLVYRVELERIDGSAETSMPVIFIDAKNGEEVWRYDNLQTASGTGLYTGGTAYFYSYKPANSSLNYLEDTIWGVGTYTNNGTENTTYYMTDADDSWTAPWQQAGVDAHYGAFMTVAYYWLVQGRDGIDGSGGPGYYTSVDGSTPLITSMVHYGTNFNNAGWTGGNHMVYGDGDGTTFGPFASLDVVGHELTHGVTQYTANLIYSGESGAINESMSDVFGAMVERWVRGESANTWKIGEQIYTPGVANDSMRWMDDPHAGSSNWYIANDPDHYTLRYTGSIDNGGVHSNSGIGNKAFYLVAKGGSHRLGGSMNGIGPDQAAGIWYKALTSFMTSSSDYHGARKATLNAAAALHTTQSSQYTAVQQAWSLVGVDKCSIGSALQSNDSAPVQAICAADSYCCNTSWDSICVAESRTIAGSLACPEAQGSCSHTLCSEGSALGSGCDSGKAACVASVCAVDSYCCNNYWDAQCVAEVASVCGKNCN